MFMHGSCMHILGNMISPWAFGPEIEDAMNPLRYLGFYLAGGLAAMRRCQEPCESIGGVIAVVMGFHNRIGPPIAG